MTNEEKLNDAESILRISITELPELDLKNIPFQSYKGIANVMVNYANNERNKVIEGIGLVQILIRLNMIENCCSCVPCSKKIDFIIDKLSQLKEQK